MKQLLMFSAISLALLGGCTKIKQLANINFNVPYSTQVSVPQVDGLPAGYPIPLGGADLPSVTVSAPTNSQEYMSKYGTAAGLITNVSLKTLALQILTPTAGQNFDFLDNVHVYLSAKGQPEVMVASKESIPKGATTLDLNTNTDVNLKNYFVQDTIYFRLAAHINAVPAAGEQLNISSVFRVTANPLN